MTLVTIILLIIGIIAIFVSFSLTKDDVQQQINPNLKTELTEANANIGAAISYCEIDTDFEQTKSVHEQLMGRIVDVLSIGSHILVDITYGPKDLPIVIFSALNFAEKYLDCTVDNIVYGQASFVNGKAVDTKICDMIPLYCLGSITNTIRCDEPEKAKSMLKALLAL